VSAARPAPEFRAAAQLLREDVDLLGFDPVEAPRERRPARPGMELVRRGEKLRVATGALVRSCPLLSFCNFSWA